MTKAEKRNARKGTHLRPRTMKKQPTTHYFSKPLIAKKPTIGHGRRTLPHQPGS